MKILLINAPTFSSHFYGLPLGLGYVAAALESKGFQVEILDANLAGKWAGIHKEIMNRSFDVAGISSMTHNFLAGLEIAGMAKEKSSAITVVLGGAHVTLSPEDAAGSDVVDYVIAGEGEESFTRLIQDIVEKKIPSTNRNLSSSRFMEKFYGGFPLIKDVDAIPYPAFHLLDISKYNKFPHGTYYKNKPFVPLITSRGCPYECAFCVNPLLSGKNWRSRSPRNVVDEIEFLISGFGVREVHFEDENLTLDKARTIEICREILSRKLEISWKCPDGVLIDSMDEELLSWMKKSGCYSLSFGIESGDPEILRRANKSINPEKTKEIVNLAKRMNIHTVGFFILGLPGETGDSIKKTIRHAVSLPLDTAQFNLCVPLPKSGVRNYFRERGYAIADDFTKYSVDHALVSTPALSSQDLYYWRKKAFWEFYRRPRILWGNLKRINSMSTVLSIIRRLRNIFR